MSLLSKKEKSFSDTADSIHVICRFRPIKKSDLEGYPNSPQAYSIDEERGTVEASVDSYERKSINFTFDKIFGMDSTQSQVFEEIQPIVDSVISGFNGTVLAYGQTSSGKTHTMEGPSLRDTVSQGVIPRTIDKIFCRIQQADATISFTLSVTYYEIYNERIRDLLNPQQDNMKIREKPDGFTIQDVTEVYCIDKEGVIRVIEMGKTNRASAPTLMNAESSRSHSILSIQINQKIQTTGRHRRGKLFLVDLAGSEKVSKTGAKGARLEEAKSINKSLTTLGMVINALCDGLPHVPYRDSKLTRVLTDSLGGNSKTTLIICCAPEARHAQETITTLRFGERAKRIKNNAKVNEELSSAELKLMLQSAKREIANLMSQLKAAGVSVAATEEADSPASEMDLGSGEQQFELLVAKEEAEEEVRLLTLKLQELQEELRDERHRADADRASCLVLEAEVASLRKTIADLEIRIVATKLGARKYSLLSNDGRRSSVGECAEGGDLNTRSRSPSAIFSSSQQSRTRSSTRVASDDIRTADVLPFVTEIEESDLSLDRVEQEEGSPGVRSAPSDGSEVTNGWVEQEYEAHVQRLMTKLAHEQQARSEVEERLEEALRQLWKLSDANGFYDMDTLPFAPPHSSMNGDEHTSSGIDRLSTSAHGSGSASGNHSNNSGSRIERRQSSFGGLFGFFGGKSQCAAKPTGGDAALGYSSHNSFFRAGSSSNLTSFVYNIRPSGRFSRERDLQKTVAAQERRIANLVSELQSTREAQIIVMEIKESVLRTLLRQNALMTVERDKLQGKSEELTATVARLSTGLHDLQRLSLESAVAQKVGPDGSNGKVITSIGVVSSPSKISSSSNFAVKSSKYMKGGGGTPNS